MKTLLIFAALLTLCFSLLTSRPAAADEPPAVERITALIDQIQKKYTPDKTTAVFQVKLGQDSNTAEVESTDPAAIAEFERRLKADNITLALIPRLLPAKELNGKVFGVATLSVCNNRTAPANAAEMATQMLLGTPVEVLKRERGYFLVRTPDRYLAWTDDDSIAPMDSAAFQQWKRAEKVVFVAEYGHSYTQPSAVSPRVSDLVAGNILELLETTGDFLKVRYPDERLAYIPASQTMLYSQWLSRRNPDADTIINAAKMMLGVPYLWGGTSNKGVDCSGFTKTAFYQHGIILPRDASQQAAVGVSVDITENGAVSTEKCVRNLIPGDLLFFGRARQQGGAPRISHTALYLGKGEFIQAAGQVRISSLLADAPNYDEVRTRTLLSARRVLTAVGTPDITRMDHHPLYRAQAPDQANARPLPDRYAPQGQ
ncbi:MAG: NlpC/P60 family protein [Armatimonadota bacterium]